MGNPVIHFEVTGRDAAKLRSFYGELFDWKIDTDNPIGYGMIDTNGGIAGGIGGTQDGSEGMVTFYVEVDDLPKALEKAKSLGGSTLVPPMDVPGGPSIALFADPEGHVVGIVKGM